LGCIQGRRIIRLDAILEWWAATLTLNRTPRSLSVLEEALILHELVQSGTSPSEIGQMLGRHRSWVCRRFALVERLPRMTCAIRGKSASFFRSTRPSSASAAPAVMSWASNSCARAASARVQQEDCGGLAVEPNAMA
jgi:hypothetical protein